MARRLHPPCVLLIASLCTASCAAPQPRSEEVTVWRPLGKWSGRGLLQTEAFLSDTGQLRVTWEARPAVTTPDPGTLRVSVHSAVSGRFLALAVDRRGPGRDTAYVNEDPRSFYLVIESANLDWSVEVAEGIPATRRSANLAALPRVMPLRLCDSRATLVSRGFFC